MALEAARAEAAANCALEHGLQLAADCCFSSALLLHHEISRCYQSSKAHPVVLQNLAVI